jgi:hypothetical protein
MGNILKNSTGSKIWFRSTVNKRVNFSVAVLYLIVSAITGFFCFYTFYFAEIYISGRFKTLNPLFLSAALIVPFCITLIYLVWGWRYIKNWRVISFSLLIILFSSVVTYSINKKMDKFNNITLFKIIKNSDTGVVDDLYRMISSNTSTITMHYTRSLLSTLYYGVPFFYLEKTGAGILTTDEIQMIMNYIFCTTNKYSMAIQFGKPEMQLAVKIKKCIWVSCKRNELSFHCNLLEKNTCSAYRVYFRCK